MLAVWELTNYAVLTPFLLATLVALTGYMAEQAPSIQC